MVSPHIHVAVPSVAILLVTLSRELETYHCVLNLANKFISVPMAKVSQDFFEFTWEGRQWTFLVLQQWYVRSPIYCCNLVACHLVE